MKACWLLASLVLLSLARLSTPMGTVFVDTINPVLNSATFINSTQSDIITTSLLDFGVLAISNLNGITFPSTGPIVLSASTMSISVPIGFQQSGANTNFSTSGTFSATGSTVNLISSSTYVDSGNGGIYFNSETNTQVTGQSVYLEGIYGLSVQAQAGNVEMTSEQLISTTSSQLSLTAVESLQILSDAGTIELIAAGNASLLSSNYLQMLAQYGVHFACSFDMTLSAPSFVSLEGRATTFSILQNISITSQTRSVDFVAGTLLAAQSRFTNIQATNLYLTASGTNNSNIEFYVGSSKATNSLLLGATTMNIVAENYAAQVTNSHLFSSNAQAITAAQQLQFGNAEATTSINVQGSSGVSLSTSLYDIELDVYQLAISASNLALSGQNLLTFAAQSQTYTTTQSTSTASGQIQMNCLTLSLAGTTLDITSLSHTIVAQEMQVSSASVVFNGGNVAWTANSDIDVTGSQLSISASQSISFTGTQLNFDSTGAGTTFTMTAATIVMNAQQQVTMAATNSLSFAATVLSLSSAGNILVQGTSINGTTDTLQATGVNDLFMGANTLSLSSSGIISLGAVDDISWSSYSNINFVVTNAASFSTGGRIAVQANGVSIAAASGTLSVSAGVNLLLATEQRFGTLTIGNVGTIPITATNSVTFTSMNQLTMSTTTNLVASGAQISLEGYTALNVNTGPLSIQSTSGDVSVVADGSAYFTASSTQVNGVEVQLSANNNYWSVGTLSATAATGAINGYTVNVVATGSTTSSTVTANGGIYLNAYNPTQPSVFSNLVITTQSGGVEFYAIGNFLINSTTSQTLFKAPTAQVSTHNQILLKQNVFSLASTLNHTASAIANMTYNYQTISLAVNKQLNFTANNAIQLLSDQSLSLTLTNLAVNAQSINMTGTVDTYIANNALTFQAGQQLNFQIAGGLNVAAGPQIQIQTPQNVTLSAGRQLLLRATSSVNFTAATGDVAINSAANIRQEGAAGLTVVALNGLFGVGAANLSMLANNNIGISTAHSGVQFQAQGLVDGTNALVVTTTSTRGNILFDAVYSQIVINGRDNFVLSSGAQVSLQSATGTTINPGKFLSLSTNTGSIVLSGATNVNITAGSPLLSGSLTIGGQYVNVLAQDVITIQSQGPFSGNGVSIAAATGNILFETGSSQLISVVSTSDLLWLAGRSFTINSTFDLSAQTNGSLSFQSLGQMSVTTVGGPIVFDATTGSDGAISISAGQAVTLVSGNNLIANASRDINWTAGLGITVTSNEDINVFGGQQDAQISFSAGLAVSFISTGVRNEPADGVFMTAANNIGLTAGQVAFNSHDTFTIGATTRPIVRMNAGGSPSTPGITLNSQGNVVLNSLNGVQISAGNTITMRIANSVAALSNGPMTIQTNGNQQNAVIDAQAGTTTFEGNLFLVNAADSISFSTVGIFQINSLGTRPTDQILFSAGKVQMISQTMQIQTVQLEATISGNTTMSTASDGTFQTMPGSRGVISVVATDSLSLLANSEMSFSTNLPNSPLTIETQGNSSMISVSTARSGSPINFLAAGLLSNEASTMSFTAVEGITLDSNDQQSNSDSQFGTISMFASGNIQMNTALSFSLIGNDGVYLQTTNVNGSDVGAPITLNATGALDFSSAESISISNVPTYRGSITFIATGNDLSLIDDNSGFQGIYMTAQSNVNFVTNASLSWVTTNALLGSATGNILFTAAGRDKSGLFGLLVETTTSNIIFSSKQGYLTATGNTGVNVFAGSSTLQSNLAITTGFQGSIIGHGANSNGDGVKIQTQTGPISLTATQGAISMSAGGSVQIYSAQGPVSLVAGGTDPSTTYGIRFASLASGATIDVRTLDPNAATTWTSVEGVHLLATGATAALTINTPISLQITTQNGGTVLFSASNSLTMSSATTIQVTAPVTNFQSTGPVVFNAKSIAFSGAAGTTQAFSISTTDNAANTNIQLLATNTLTFFSTTNPASVVLEATSPAGANVIVASGEGSVVVNAATIHLETDASVAFESSLLVNIQSPAGVTQLTADNQVTFSSAYSSTSSSNYAVNLVGTTGATISANEVFFDGPANRINSGSGSFLLQTQAAVVGQEIDIEASALNVGGSTLTLTAPTILLSSPQKILFETQLTIVQTEKFLIPFDPTATAFALCTNDRELVFNPNTKQLCVCSSYYFFSDQPGANPLWMCMVLID